MRIIILSDVEEEKNYQLYEHLIESITARKKLGLFHIFHLVLHVKWFSM